MNCSESQRLSTLLRRLLLELHHQGNASSLGAGPGPSMGMGVVPDPYVGREVTSAKADDSYIYILLIMIFYVCVAGGIILVYNRSRKLVDDKNEAAPAYVEHEWSLGGALVDAERAAASPASGGRQLAPGGLPAFSQSMEGV
ncbi:potassium voltage-gated channel subfamily E regulatory beta subunit 5 [Sorex fumeus]|uniref:potassium voltage-gated channel subfamily E regulatory beta subunit 5 n=1 Tax=Sorex fumeus TaxID=62283 RepID=UPI0024AE3749|nr:potassium voltage-gated channel subfamily E regulatory beta subunit 5 [Sorex fumeus]